MGGSLTMMLKGFTALFLISSVCARHFLIETEGDGKKESDAGADSKSSKETESIIQAELESYAELVRDRIKSGSGQAEVKAMLAKEGMKISPQALVTLFGDDLDMIESWKDVEDLWIDDLVDTLYTLYKDGEIVVRWVGDKISHE